MPASFILNGFDMRRAAVIFLVLYAFAVPWEYALDLGEPLGNIARILNVLTLLVCVPCVVEAGRIRRPGALVCLVFALYMFFVCSFFWTVDVITTFGKIRSYIQVMMSVWLIWELVETPEQLRDLLRAFVGGCWVLAALTFVNFTTASSIVTGQTRFAAEGQDPNDVARFLDLGMPFAALLFTSESRLILRLAAIFYIPAGLLAVLLTASRGGFSASLAALAGSAVLLGVWKPKRASIILSISTIFAGLLWLVVPQSTMDRLGTIPEQLASSDLNDRLNIWIAGWHAFAREPWFGHGAGTYAFASGLSEGDTAHNTLMAMLVTGGVFGAALFLACIVSVAWYVSQTKGLLRIALVTTLIVWAITAMVGSVEENRATWLLLGWMAAAGRLASNPALATLFGGHPKLIRRSALWDARLDSANSP